MKVTKNDLPETIDKIKATFESYWNASKFEYYCEAQKERLARALKAEKYFNNNESTFIFDIRPYSYQQEILDKLKAERTVRSYYKNLVIAATGTGKTVISAFDYKRFKKQNPDKPCRLLFVAHREEILKQSMYTFRGVLKDNNFGKRKQEKREATSKKIEQLFNAPNYKEALMELRNDTKFHSELSKFSFAGDVGGKIPFFIDIPITGEMIFCCDRRIWQGAIFDRFVYNRKSDEKLNATIHIKKIQKWLIDYQETIKINWSLASKAYVCINGRETNYSLFYDVVKKYLEYLTEIGFLSTLLYQEATVERTHSLVPPDSTGAARLQAALQSVDLYSPHIDFVIQHILHPRVSYYSHVYFSENIELQAQKENEDMKAMLLKTKLNKRKLGHESVKLKNFYSNAPIYDDFGSRWLYCTECNMIKREDEMSSYGGVNRTNLGICRECSRRNAHDQNLQQTRS